MHDGRWERDRRGIEVFDVEAPGPSGSRTRRPKPGAKGGRRRVSWRPLSLVAIAALAAVAVAALADRPSPVPSPLTAQTTATPAAPTASPSPATEEPSAPATLGPYWPAQIGLPLITVPADAARLTVRQPDVSASPAGSASGPFIYSPFALGEAPDSVGMLDVGRGTQYTLPLPLKTGESLVGSRTDGTWLAVGVQGQDPNDATTMPWRLLVARLSPDGHAVGGAGGFAQVAAGKEVGRKIAGQDGLLMRAPQFELVAGRLVWAEESPSGAGSVVRVRALDSRHTTTFKLKQYAAQLALSADAVAWLESPDPAAADYPPGIVPPAGAPAWQVMEVGPGDAEPHWVDIGVHGTQGGVPMPQIVLNSSAVVATLFGQDGSPTKVVQVDPAGLTVIDDGSHGRACTASAASDGVVLLACGWPGITRASNGQTNPLYLGATWTPSRGLRVITIGSDEPPTAYGILAQAGWALLVGDQWTAIPMSALAAQ